MFQPLGSSRKLPPLARTHAAPFQVARFLLSPAASPPGGELQAAEVMGFEPLFQPGAACCDRGHPAPGLEFQGPRLDAGSLTGNRISVGRSVGRD